MSAATDIYLGPRRELALPGAGVDWVDRIRADAAQRFSETGLPSLRDEDWKYTNIKPITRLGFQPAVSNATQITAAQLQRYSVAGLDTYRLTFVNGIYAPSLSTLDGLPPGATATTLANALQAGDEALQGALGSCLPQTSHGFTLLNSAYLTDGVYLQLEPGCEVDKPLEFLFVVTDDDTAQVVQPRNLIVARDNSRCTVVERYVGAAGAKSLTNTLTEIIAGQGAAVDHYKLQEESDNAFHVAGLFIIQERDSSVTNHNIAIGAALARTDLRVNLNGAGAHCGMNGLYLGSGKQHIDNHSQIDHVAPQCTSDEYYKGLLTDRARGVFHGRIIVHPGAQLTDAQQQNNNLLLSQDAEVDTKPQLEIYADDVKCSHGATVGQLDKTSLFYLLSRGIDEETARGLLTFAFAKDVINRLDLEPLRQHLEGILPAKLHRPAIEDSV